MTNTFFSGLVQLGAWFRGEVENAGPEDDALLRFAEVQNRWFSPAFVKEAMKANGEMLREEVLERWFADYSELKRARSSKHVGLVLAGNLPMVGWHDVLCVLLSGHRAIVKCSSEDKVLIPAAVAALDSFCAEDIASRVEFVSGTLQGADAVIATGSANTNRYFEYYFRHLPRVLRSQRTSIAVLSGSESHEQLRALGSDVFQYYGLGCRSVTKLMLPRGFDLNRLFAAWVEWGHIAQNNKYANNYDYHKAVWLLNGEDLIENGFLLVKEDKGWVSPVGTLYYAWYDQVASVRDELEDAANSLQCITTEISDVLNVTAVPSVPLGHAQKPKPWDYADGVDTLNFLLALSS